MIERSEYWRWLVLAMGVLLVTHGIFNKHMRVRNGTFKGEVLKKPWQIFLMRSWLVVIGLAVCIFAFTFDRR